MVSLRDWRSTRDLPLCGSPTVAFRRVRGQLSLEQRRRLGRFGRSEGQRTVVRPLAGSSPAAGYGFAPAPDLAKSVHGTQFLASLRRDRAWAAAAAAADAEGDEDRTAAAAAVAAAVAGPDGEAGIEPPPPLFDASGAPRPMVLGVDVRLRQLHEFGVPFALLTDAHGNAVATDAETLAQLQKAKAGDQAAAKKKTGAKKGGKGKKKGAGKGKKKGGGGGKKKGKKKKK